MSQIQDIQIVLDGISNILKTKRFKVPAYQRSYAWEIEHVEALLNDVHESIKSKEHEYFLGSLVVTGQSEKRYEVVDGQQRLTTVSLLIAAIKDIFKREGDEDVVTSVKTEFLASTDRKSREKEPKLVLNEIDNELYQDLIESIPNIQKEKYTRQSHKRLIDAAETIYKYLEDLCTKSKDSEEELHSWLDYLESNLKVILVTAPDDSNAFVIFETLNDRGLELAISDLLKNYLFLKSGEKIEETKNRWLSMVAILESASDDPLIVQYLRHFAMSKYGLIREKDLYGVIKKKITSKKSALSFSTELAERAKTYSALLNTDHELWSKYEPSVKESIASLNTLGMIQIRPLILAIIDKFDNKNISGALQKLVSVAVRFQVVGGVGGGLLERYYADTAKAVSDGNLSTIKDLVATFTSVPTDSAFKDAFSIASFSKQKLARFYLRCIETHLSNGQLQSSLDTGKVNLEHILPQTLNEYWSNKFTTEEHKAAFNRLGNLTLMSSKTNSSFENESFEEKSSEYKKSEFKLTKSISENIQWTKKEIELRQSAMADIAVQVWTLK
ncbi:DUF262 domain-containing protein [Methylophilus methylotrophus]|uniref:DUF262 domain-containing protein n=1 Tax=Methylophilus methylotrophus TaxID=17 RepID=UPI0003718EBB|nr:DUF262 domain-containing protein [Methylophilus methylotrophus]